MNSLNQITSREVPGYVNVLGTATAVGPQQRIDFDYDWRGRRISKRVWNNTARSGYPTIILNYAYDGWNLLAELAGFGGNSVLASYGWGLDLSGGLQGAGGVGGLASIWWTGLG